MPEELDNNAMQEAAEKQWEIANAQMRDNGGVNPYAYVLGFKDAVKFFSAPIIKDKDAEIENWKKVVLSEQATIQELKKQIEIINQKNNT